ncbi:MAG: DUF2085 domain-containing protein, partial [Anaerolineaceae bacterium]|nr:DUF2085 domain-containing protein [Anaerolineaceae bacterium]
MVVVTIYLKKDCNDCNNTISTLAELADVVPHRLVKVFIDDDPDLLAVYGTNVPVVQAGPYKLQFPFTKQDLEIVLRSAQDRIRSLEQDETGSYQKRVERGAKITGADRFTHWLSYHYMIAFNFLAFLFLGLAFLAPILMQAGLEVPAKVLYTVYKPMCHQFSFRSWFLFGDQPYYPRALANVDGVITYEELAALIPDKIITVDGKDTYEAYTLSRFPDRLIVPESPGWELSARKFIGVDNAVVHTGYKVALCERDVAIWGAFLVFGLVFSLFRTKIRPLPWYFWAIFGIFPIGLDGGSQLLGFLSGMLPDWLVIRESTPLLRTLTGAMFGITTGWLLYPLIEQTMADTRRFMVKKLASIAQRQAEVSEWK